jgi:hypothetical protein
MAIHGETQQDSEKKIRVGEDGQVWVTSEAAQPVHVMAPDDRPLSTAERGRRASSDVNQVQDIGSSASTYTLPEPGGVYLLIASGNAAYLRWDGGTATTSTGGFSMVLPEGSPVQLRLAADEVSYIGTSAAGTIAFVHLQE